MRLPVARRLPLVAVLITAGVAFPLGALASHQFGDVLTSNIFHDDIDAIADAGVTTGCGGGNYCPADFVTREQMAAFMNRLGALAPGKTPVVNATKLDGRDSTDFLGAGIIVVQHMSPWQRSNGGWSSPITNVTLLPFASTGDGTNNEWYLPLSAPASIDGVAYGLASVEICVQDSGAYVNSTQVTQVIGTSTSVIGVNSDDQTGSGCYTLVALTNSAASGAYHLQMHAVYPGSAGAIFVNTVRATWVPV